MKNIHFAFIALLIFTSGCKKKIDSYAQTVEFSGNKPKKIGESTFMITEVNDSRCPQNAVCVMAGKATVSLSVQTDFDVQNFTLCIGDCKAIGATDNIVFTSANTKYMVKLKKVSPYPAENKLLLPKFVTLDIVRSS